jgi:arsenate reductase-like glutaredoxin family protein
MLIVHGIKSCDSVKKALKFLKENAIEHSFRDFKEIPVGCDELSKWLEYTTLNKLFNSKSSTYRQLNLKEMALTADEKIDWLCKKKSSYKKTCYTIQECYNHRL